MVLVWTFPARRVTTAAQIYGWAPRRGGRQWRPGTASPVQDHPVMVHIGAGHPAPAKNRASMSVRRSLGSSGRRNTRRYEGVDDHPFLQPNRGRTDSAVLGCVASRGVHD